MGPTVLVVDDDEDIREMIALVLELYGYVARTAGGAREALAQLAADPLPSVILLDLMMPEMSGGELLARLRRDPRLEAVPVIVISGGGSLRDLVTRGEADAWLSKPVDSKDLLGTVRRFAVPLEGDFPAA